MTPDQSIESEDRHCAIVYEDGEWMLLANGRAAPVYDQDFLVTTPLMAFLEQDFNGFIAQAALLSNSEGRAHDLALFTVMNGFFSASEIHVNLALDWMKQVPDIHLERYEMLCQFMDGGPLSSLVLSSADRFAIEELIARMKKARLS